MADSRDVVWLDFPGAAITKRRPAVIVSSKEYHSVRPDFILGLLTSQVTKASGPTDHVLADWSAAGLHKPSAFRAFLVTVPKSAVLSTLGRISDADWRAIQECLKRAIDVS